MVRSHHEHWDGKGYPERLQGAAIPLSARLFAVVDAVMSMATGYPDRPSLTLTVIREEVQRLSGSQFDPDIVQALLRIPEADWSAAGWLPAADTRPEPSSDASAQAA